MAVRVSWYRLLIGCECFRCLTLVCMHALSTPGTCTLCYGLLDKHSATLHALNFGDSGYFVIRQGRIAVASETQTSGFNTPYQVGLDNLRDIRHAHIAQHQLEAGDVLAFVTDGVLDNLFNANIETIVAHAGPTASAQELANAICTHAHSAAHDPSWRSPFTEYVLEHYGELDLGGKVDDITALVLRVL